jgi:hypothetical protein
MKAADAEKKKKINECFYIDGTYSIDGEKINVYGNCSVRPGVKLGMLCEKLDGGMSFGSVNGDFNCAANHLTSLAGAPETVGGDFDCSKNYLESLDKAPKKVGGDFDCSKNSFKSLKEIPKNVVGRIMITYDSNLPLLDVFYENVKPKPKVIFFGKPEITKIIEKYVCRWNTTECGLKEIIMDCALELRKNGFKGNVKS